MNRKFFVAVFVVVAALAALIVSAVNNTAKAVVTVDQLVEQGVDRNNIRLGARVAEGEIAFEQEPQMMVSFKVRDISNEKVSFPVQYNGVMPDTLKVDRDVILEGDYLQRNISCEFFAHSMPIKIRATNTWKILIDGHRPFFFSLSLVFFLLRNCCWNFCC